MSVGLLAAPMRLGEEAKMKIQLLLLSVAGLALVSASPPSDPIPWEDEASLSEYPPCSRTVTDRCRQSYEGGAVSAGRKEQKSMAHAEHKAKHGQKHAAADYPPCSATVTDRCIQSGGRGAGASTVRMARAPKQRHHERRMQLAMRAGERG